MVWLSRESPVAECIDDRLAVPKFCVLRIKLLVFSKTGLPHLP